MKLLPVKATAACVACLLSVATPTPARAQDAPAPAANGATPEPDTALSGAENLTAAIEAIELMEQAAALRKEKKDSEADDLKASIEEAQIAAFHPPEFEKTLKRAEELASKAKARSVEVKEAADQARARFDNATKAFDAAKKTGDSDDIKDARKELQEAQKERDAAEKAETAAADAVKEANLALDHAQKSIKAAQAAITLAAARAGVVERAFTQSAVGAAPAAVSGSAVASAAELQTQINAQKVLAFNEWLTSRRHLKEYEKKKVDAQKAKEKADAAAPTAEVTLANGARLSWGLAGSLLRFQTQRSESLPGRVRNFRPRLEFVPGEVGFQFLSEPATTPWRLQLENGQTLQLMSWGGLLLASLGEDKALERGSLSLAATLAFFKNVIGFGAGFDLYRGIPVLGANGTPGGDTAFTGVLAWALAQEGEVTAENAFFVVTVNLSSLAELLTGKENGQ